MHDKLRRGLLLRFCSRGYITKRTRWGNTFPFCLGEEYRALCGHGLGTRSVNYSAPIISPSLLVWAFHLHCRAVLLQNALAIPSERGLTGSRGENELGVKTADISWVFTRRFTSISALYLHLAPSNLLVDGRPIFSTFPSNQLR